MGYLGSPYKDRDQAGLDTGGEKDEGAYSPPTATPSTGDQICAALSAATGGGDNTATGHYRPPRGSGRTIMAGIAS